MTILKNKAQCLKCGDIIESKYVHDFVHCKCGEIFVDGGKMYLRRGAKNWKNFRDLYESREHDSINLPNDDEQTLGKQQNINWHHNITQGRKTTLLKRISALFKLILKRNTKTYAKSTEYM